MIPIELRNLNQWVVAEPNSKAPMQVGGFPASSTNRITWDTYAHCKEWVDYNGGYLGFVFNDNAIVGIDIDDGIIDGELTDLAKDIVKHCPSYTEISKSGTGIHIFIRGELPFRGKNNRNGVEIYQTARYFVMTEKQLPGTPDTLEQGQKGIDYVLETYFAEELKESKDLHFRNDPFYKPKFKTLSLHPYYPKISEGCRHLSMVSLAGRLHSCNFTGREILEELTYANKKACEPMLPTSELQSIVYSVSKYRR